MKLSFKTMMGSMSNMSSGQNDGANSNDRQVLKIVKVVNAPVMKLSSINSNAAARRPLGVQLPNPRAQESGPPKVLLYKWNSNETLAVAFPNATVKQQIVVSLIL